MFAQRLKIARKRKGLTQQQAAEALNLSMRSYQRYEAINGSCEPPFQTLVQLADLFQTSVDWLLGRDEYLESLGVSVDEFQ